MKLPLTGDPAADRLLEDDPLALLIGMLLDQQVPMEKAFRGPYDLKERLGRLDASEIASADAEALVAVFRGPPALHRYPGSMAGRTQDLCRTLVEQYDGDAGVGLGVGRHRPGALSQPQGVAWVRRAEGPHLHRPAGQAAQGDPARGDDVAGPYGQVGHFSVADIDGPDALAAVREHKKSMKAAAKAAQAT